MRAAYSSRWRSPRKWRSTWVRAFRPRRLASTGSRRRRSTAAPKLSTSCGSWTRSPVSRPRSDRRSRRPRSPPPGGSSTSPRHGETEALGEALLGDDRGVPLERVDHERVLDRVVHRDGGEFDALPDIVRQRPPLGDRLRPEQLAFRIVRDAAHRGADERQPRVRNGDVASEPLEHATHVLDPVPARDLHHEGVRGSAGGPSRTTCAGLRTRSSGWTPSAATSPAPTSSARTS